MTETGEMAAYALYLGSPVGKPILKDKERCRKPDDMLGIDSLHGDGLVLSHDLYATRVWSGPELTGLAGDLEQEIATVHQAAVGAVLTQTRRAALEPWMDAMIAGHLAGDARDSSARRLLDMVKRAKQQGGTIIFWAD